MRIIVIFLVMVLSNIVIADQQNRSFFESTEVIIECMWPEHTSPGEKKCDPVKNFLIGIDVPVDKIVVTNTTNTLNSGKFISKNWIYKARAEDSRIVEINPQISDQTLNPSEKVSVEFVHESVYDKSKPNSLPVFTGDKVDIYENVFRIDYYRFEEDYVKGQIYKTQIVPVRVSFKWKY